MPDLEFCVKSAEPERDAAVPFLVFKLEIAENRKTAASPTRIHAVVLRCQVQIEPARRRYSPGEQERLLDLFGTPDRWGKTLRPLFWTHAGQFVGPFAGAVIADLSVPCCYDFSLAPTKYFDALEAGEVPLCFLFSGTVFYEGPDGEFQVSQVPWEKEATFRLPVALWKSLMNRFYPNCAWLGIHKEALDCLNGFRHRSNLASWDQTMAELLAERNVPQPPRADRALFATVKRSVRLPEG